MGNLPNFVHRSYTIISFNYISNWKYAVAQLVEATSQKVVGLILDGVNGNFH